MNSKGHVLLVGNFFSEKGSRQVCQDLAERLDAAGWQVFTTSAQIPRLRRMSDMLQTIWRYRNRYQVAQVDVFSGLSFLWAEAAALLLSLLNKPFILTLHGGMLPAFSQRHARRVTNVLNRASVVTTPSAYLLNEMKPYRSDLVLMHNLIDLSRYSFQRRTLPTPRIVWLRAFAAVYNPCLAAEVVAILRKEFPDIQLTMIGPDKEDGTFQRFQADVSRLGIANRVNLLGRIEKADVPQFLQQGDIFLNTTNVDNAPVSVVEAMACGLCVVSTNVGGIPYLLEHEQDSLLVPPGDAQAMADAIRRILTEQGLAGKLSDNGRAKAQEFDWSTSLSQWESLLTSVIERHG